VDECENLPATTSLSSAISSPYRKSGLSQPYLLMASAYVMRRNGRGPEAHDETTSKT